MPPFETQYAVLPGIGQSSCTDVMLMIRPPPPWAIICLAAELSAVEGALQVDRQHPVVLLFGRVEDRGPGLDAGVVDHDVNPAELLDGGVDQALEVIHLADVGLDADRPFAQCHDLSFEILRGLLVRHVVDDDVGAGGGETEHHSLSDATVSTGDDGHFAFECHDIAPFRWPQWGGCQFVVTRARDEMVADPYGIGHRRERRVHGADAGEEAGVDNVEVVDLVRPCS